MSSSALGGGQDEKRSWAVQCKVVEDLVRDNQKLKEDPNHHLFGVATPL